MKSNYTTSYNTNLTNAKEIYKLENIDCEKLNDNKGKELTIENFIIKTIEKAPVYDEEQKLVEQYEIKVITILNCKEGNYVTASRFFSNQLIDYINRFGLEEVKDLKIRVIEKDVKNSKNRALGFELV